MTIVVAGHDSSAEDKARADYICDGTDDQFEIQEALSMLRWQIGPWVWGET